MVIYYEIHISGQTFLEGLLAGGRVSGGGGGGRAQEWAGPGVGGPVGEAYSGKKRRLRSKRL